MPTAIHIQNLSVSYEEETVLENLSLEVPQGRITGILGPNGAGKSTLFKVMLGLLPPNQGSVRFGGKPFREIREEVAYVPQKDGVNWDFPATVEDVVMMGRYPHKAWFSRMTASDRQKAQKALRDLGMQSFARRQIGALSGGQQQRMFIARALCQEANTLLLDEPFVGVDIKTEQQIMAILRQLTQAGKTILIIHHDLSKVRDYFDDILLLNRRVISAGPVGQHFTKEAVAEAYQGQVTFL